jgi:hypothetical protein
MPHNPSLRQAAIAKASVKTLHPGLIFAFTVKNDRKFS